VAAADNTVVTVDRGPGDDGGVPDGGSIETFTLNSQGQMLYGGCSSAIPFGLTCTGEPNPVVITSQDSAHPIYVGQYLNGCGTNTVDCGDPDFVNVLAPAQFLNRYVFYTDVSYPTTALTIVRKAVDKKFKDVTLDCLGTISGFVPAGSKGEYETAVAVIKKQNLFAGTCKDGLQTATSDGPFGITVWGLANYASYGYPAGGNVSTLNAVYLSPEPK
jgi:hypothetical protein